VWSPCQIYGARADFHIMENRPDGEAYYHVCTSHRRHADEGTIQPLTADQTKSIIREHYRQTIDQRELLEKFDRAFPEIFAQPATRRLNNHPPQQRPASWPNRS